MSESIPQSSPEMNNDDEIFLRVHQVLDAYFPEDKLFVQVEGMDADEAIDFAYAQLLEYGEDPDVVFVQFGLLDEGNDEQEGGPSNGSDSVEAEEQSEI